MGDIRGIDEAGIVEIAGLDEFMDGMAVGEKVKRLFHCIAGDCETDSLGS